MPWKNVLFLALPWLLLPSAESRAQFYTPATEYHDPIQRMFPVELARVLAWEQNRSEGGQKVSHIAYRVDTTGDRQTVWNLEWRSGGDQILREWTVEYAEGSLTNGPAFYREVFRQSAGPLQESLPDSAEAEVIRRFWLGAEEGGLSRMEGIRNAFPMIRADSETALPERAPHLAGLLAHATLPSLAGSVTLDPLLMARAAAWLCISEATIEKPTPRIDALWTPLIFLAGREREAWQIWNRALPDSPAGAPHKGRAVDMWNLMAQEPGLKAACAFAADPEQRKHSMPMLIYYSEIARRQQLLSQLTYPMFLDQQGTLMRLHDYSSWFVINTGIGGGRISEGHWPAAAREEWARALRDYPYTGHHLQSHIEAAGKAVEFFENNRPDLSITNDASLHGFTNCAPLIEMGFSDAEGPLIPTAVASTRDLLVYGWETTGLQMGFRHYFVDGFWGVPQLAEPIVTNVLTQISGLNLFFRRPREKPFAKAPMKNPRRLQYLDRYVEHLLSETDVRSFVNDDASEAEDARLFALRRWLSRGQVRSQLWGLAENKHFREVTRTIRRLRQEGGTLMDYELLNYMFNHIRTDQEERIPGYLPIMQDIADRYPAICTLKVRATWSQRYNYLSRVELARAYERMFWENPDIGYSDWAFENYIIGNSYQAAKRLFLQMKRIVGSRVQFSNGLAPQAYILGMMTDDEELIQAAFSAGTGSAQSMFTEMYYSFHQDDIDRLKQQIDGYIERYQSQPYGGDSIYRLKALLTYLPALKDPKHPGHHRALDFFKGYSGWLPIQWTLATKYGLTQKEAIRLLGGEDTDELRKALVRYLQKDEDGFIDQYQQIRNKKYFNDEIFALVTFLRNKIAGIPKPLEEPDLRPEGHQTIPEIVVHAMRDRKKDYQQKYREFLDEVQNLPEEQER